MQDKEAFWMGKAVDVLPSLVVGPKLNISPLSASSRKKKRKKFLYLL